MAATAGGQRGTARKPGQSRAAQPTASAPCGPELGRLLLYAAALCSAAAGAIHIRAVGDHTEHGLMVTGFILMAAFQLTLAGMLATRTTRRILLVGVVGNLGIIGIWVASRTTGIGFVPGATNRQGIEAADLAATFLAMGVVAAAALYLVLPAEAATARLSRPAGGRAMAAVATVVALLLVPGLAVPHEHSRHEDDHALTLTSGHPPADHAHPDQGRTHPDESVLHHHAPSDPPPPGPAHVHRSMQAPVHSPAEMEQHTHHQAVNTHHDTVHANEEHSEHGHESGHHDHDEHGDEDGHQDHGEHDISYQPVSCPPLTTPRISQNNGRTECVLVDGDPLGLVFEPGRDYISYEPYQPDETPGNSPGDRGPAIRYHDGEYGDPHAHHSGWGCWDPADPANPERSKQGEDELQRSLWEALEPWYGDEFSFFKALLEGWYFYPVPASKSFHMVHWDRGGDGYRAVSQYVESFMIAMTDEGWQPLNGMFMLGNETNAQPTAPDAPSLIGSRPGGYGDGRLDYKQIPFEELPWWQSPYSDLVCHLPWHDHTGYEGLLTSFDTDNVDQSAWMAHVSLYAADGYPWGVPGADGSEPHAYWGPLTLIPALCNPSGPCL